MPSQPSIAKQDETCDESQADCQSNNERDEFRGQPLPRGDNGSTLVGARRSDFLVAAYLL
jgi:hypothetical protein